MEAILVRKSRSDMVSATSFKNNLVYLHVFVSTQGTQVVLQGVLIEESEEKHAEVHEQVEKCGGRVNFEHIFIYFENCVYCI